MSKRAPVRRSRPRAILNGVVFWIVIPIAFFTLGLKAIGPQLPKQAPAAPPQEVDAPKADPEHADNWLDDSQLPKELGPSGEARRRNAGRSKSKTDEIEKPITDTPNDNGVTVEPADKKPANDGGEDKQDKPTDPDIQKPDEIH